MTETFPPSVLPGFVRPLHRSLTEPILLGGVPRAVAITNGTMAAAIGLGLRLYIAGLLIWITLHTLALFFAKRDPQFMDVLIRHVRHRKELGC